MVIRAVVLVCLTLIVVGVFGNPTTVVPQPVYNKPIESSTPSYIPHATYPYADTFGGSAPIQSSYGTYLYPLQQEYVAKQDSSYMSSLLPAAQNAVTIAVRLFAKMGLFLMGGVALLVVGGIFTTAVCSLTPLCTINFHGLGSLDKDSMRSLMTPDRISAAAALVQDAIGKYNRLQRAVTN